MKLLNGTKAQLNLRHPSNLRVFCQPGCHVMVDDSLTPFLNAFQKNLKFEMVPGEQQTDLPLTKTYEEVMNLTGADAVSAKAATEKAAPKATAKPAAKKVAAKKEAPKEVEKVAETPAPTPDAETVVADQKSEVDPDAAKDEPAKTEVADEPAKTEVADEPAKTEVAEKPAAKVAAKPTRRVSASNRRRTAKKKQ